MANWTLPDPPEPYTPPEFPAIPEFDFTLPGGSIDWCYRAYASLLLPIIELEGEEGLKLLTSYAGLYDSQADAIWGDTLNAVTMMGYRDPLASQRRKTLSYQRYLAQSAGESLSEESRLKNLSFMLELRLKAEGERYRQWEKGTTLTLSFAKELIRSRLEACDLAISAYKAVSEAARLRLQALETVLELNNQLIRIYQAQVQILAAQGEVNRSIVQLLRNQLALQNALYEEANAEMESTRVSLKVAALQLEIQRIAIQAQVKASELVLEDARQKDLTADVAIIEAQCDEVRGIQAELQAVWDQLELAQAYAEEKRVALNDIVTRKRAAKEELREAEDDRLKADGDYVDAEVAAKEEEIQLILSEAQARLDKIGSDGDNSLMLMEGEAEGKIIEESITTRELQMKLEVEVQKYFTDETVERAKARVAEILKDAKIVNKFTEFRH